MARVVVAKHRLPYPPVTGTDVVTFNLLRALATRHDVTLVALAAASPSAGAAAAFKDIGVRVVAVPMPNKRTAAARVFYKVFYTAAAFLTGSPRDLWYYNPPAFKKKVREEAAAADLLQVEYWYLYPTADAASCRRKVLLAHDAEFKANARLLAVTTNPFLKLKRWLEYERRKGYERHACRRFDGVLTLSAADAALLAPFSRRRPEVVFPMVDLPPPGGVSRGAETRTLVYFGGTSRAANHHGLLTFARDIYPRIKALVPAARWLIRGERPRPALGRLIARDPSIKYLPPTPDVAEALRDAAVAVVPLWVGSGIKIKALTAMAYGVPVVTTPIGAEGIPAGPDDGFFVSADADAFAEVVASLLTDGTRQRAAAAAARRWAERNAALENRAPEVAAFYDELARA